LTAAYTASFIPFIAASLYRVPIIPFLLLLGAVGIDRFLDYLSGKKWKAVAGAAAAAVVLYLLAGANPVGYEPSRERWYYHQGLDFANAGQDARAIEFYRKAMDVIEDYTDCHEKLGDSYYRLGDFAEAEEHYRRALESGLGVYYYILQHYDESQVSPTVSVNASEAFRIISEKSYLFVNLAAIYRERGLYEEAIAVCEAALAARPDHAGAYVILGSVLTRMGRDEEGRAALRTARDLEPNSFRVRPGPGAPHRGIEGEAEAEGDFSKAASRKPDSAGARIGHASLYNKAGRMLNAIESVRPTRETDPGSSEAHYLMAVRFFDSDSFAKALQEYLKTIRLDRNHVDAHIGLGRLLGIAGKYAEAELILRRAIELRPDSAEAHYFLCFLYWKMGREKEFLEELNILRQLSPNLAEVLSMSRRL
jgi:tetratricopeptide (TPR) repeat protein